MSVGRTILRGGIALVALLAGVAVFALMVVTKPQPKKETRTERGTLVSVQAVKGVSEKLRITVRGDVIPERQVSLSPEVSGKIVWQHKKLIPGGRFKKGETLIRIDSKDYRLSAAQQQANVDRAQMDLKLEQGRKAIAKEEWEIIGEDPNASKEGRALALRDPQLATAKANLAAAKSAHSQARRAVGKTTLKAPFAGIVRSENVDIGQLVAPGTTLATLVASDHFWVQVAVPVDKLGQIDVPGLGKVADDQGAQATIVQEVGEQRTERSGKVLRLLGELDPVGRMARLLIRIDEPLGRKGKTDDPILLGSYVEVSVEGREVEDVVEVPRRALREGELIYVYGPDDKLQIRQS